MNGSSESGDPPRRWLNDRRFNFANSSQRIRANITQLVQDVQQTALQSPELLGPLRSQLQLISDLVNGQVPAVLPPQPPSPHPPPPRNQPGNSWNQTLRRSGSQDASGNRRNSHSNAQPSLEAEYEVNDGLQPPRDRRAPSSASSQAGTLPPSASRYNRPLSQSGNLDQTVGLAAATLPPLPRTYRIQFSPTSDAPLTVARGSAGSSDSRDETTPTTSSSHGYPLNRGQNFVVDMDQDRVRHSMPQSRSSQSYDEPLDESLEEAEEGGTEENREEEEEEEGGVGGQNPPGNGTPQTDNEDWNRIMELWNSPDVQRVLKTALKVTPFMLVLILKLLLNHVSGLLAISLGILVFAYANRQFTRFVFSRTEGSRCDLCKAAVTMAAWLVALFFVFEADQLWKSLAFQAVPLISGEHVDLSDVLWVVLSSDLILKFIFMTAKVIVGIGPNNVRANKKKRALYQWLEYSSHIYRCCVPIRPWSGYLLATVWTNTVVVAFSYALVGFYVTTKVIYLLGLVSIWRQSTRCLYLPIGFGRKPTAKELTDEGSRCSICFGDYVEPIELNCKHIFCEDCITTWLDKQRTCPVCRAGVSGDNRDWRDGSTTWMIQLF